MQKLHTLWLHEALCAALRLQAWHGLDSDVPESLPDNLFAGVETVTQTLYELRPKSPRYFLPG